MTTQDAAVIPKIISLPNELRKEAAANLASIVVYAGPLSIDAGTKTGNSPQFFFTPCRVRHECTAEPYRTASCAKDHCEPRRRGGYYLLPDSAKPPRKDTTTIPR